VLVALAGCGADGTTARPSSRAAGSTTASPSLSPTPPTRAKLQEMLRAALIPPHGLAAAGGPTTAQVPDVDDKEHPVSEFCDREYEGWDGPRVSILRSWDGDPMFVSEIVHGFGSFGVGAVEFIRATVATCRSAYITVSGSKRSVVQVVDLGTVAGTDDRFGVCQQIQVGDGKPFIWCEAFLARGHLLVDVGVRGPSNLAGTEAMLRQVVPIAASALATVS
jgi:hypothetical protein